MKYGPSMVVRASREFGPADVVNWRFELEPVGDSSCRTTMGINLILHGTLDSDLQGPCEMLQQAINTVRPVVITSDADKRLTVEFAD